MAYIRWLIEKISCCLISLLSYCCYSVIIMIVFVFFYAEIDIIYHYYFEIIDFIQAKRPLLL